MNGQVVSEMEVNVQDAVEIVQDTRTSFALSLPGYCHHSIKKTVETMQVLKRGVKIEGELSATVVVTPRSLTSTAASEKAVRKGLLGMHALIGSDTVSYPNGRGKVSALRVLTQTDID